MKKILILLVVLGLYNCKPKTDNIEVKSLTAEAIINKSIVVSGGDNFKNSEISFDFRDKKYTAKRDKTKFMLTRISFDSVVDKLSNSGFNRFVNDKLIKVADSMKPRYAASVNSVHYFSVLPYGLNDKAVNKVLLGEEDINNNAYYKIKVTFNQIGGGEDFDDIFIYWVNKETFKVDYLAYSYQENHGRGMRFREAYNERIINSLRFVDYNNYKTVTGNYKLEDLAIAFTKGKLELLSKIELKHVNVNLME